MLPGRLRQKLYRKDCCKVIKDQIYSGTKINIFKECYLRGNFYNCL